MLLMTDTRWHSLMEDDSAALTADEIAEGWHWCCEFDGLLVGPGMGELRCCRCLPDWHAAYKSVPPQEKSLTINGGLR